MEKKQNIDIGKMTGEEIAKLLSGEYQRLMVCQQNIQALNGELNRRESGAKDERKK